MTDNTRFYGIGKGGAQVADTSPLMGTFQQILAKDNARRQLEMKQLTDEQAQLKPDGLRNDADRKAYFQGVDNWRNKYIESMRETDPYKRSLLRSQADQAYMDIHSLVAESKQQDKAESAFGTQLLNPAVRDRYKPEVVDEFLKNKQRGVRESGIVKDFNTYEQIADHTKAMQALQKLDEEGIKNGQWDNGTIRTWKDNTGTTRTQTKYTQTYDPKKRFADLTRAFTMDRDVQKTLIDINPDIWNDPNMSYDQKRDAVIQKYMQDTGDQRRSVEPKDHFQQPDRFYEHHDYAVAHPVAGSGMTPTQILGTDMQNGVPGSGEKYISLIPKGQYGKDKNGRDVKPFLGIDKNTGEHVFMFPAQVDQKAKAHNDELRAKFKKLYPDDPYNPAIPGFKLEKEEKAPAKNYRLNPASPDYLSQLVEMGKEQNVNWDQLNKAESIKGGKGQIEQVRQAGTGTKHPQTYNIKGKEYKAESVRKAAAASGMSVDEYLEALK